MCDKIAMECQTPLFRKMKSLNAITKRNCSQIIQASGELPIYPFFLSRQYRNNVRITPLWYLNYRPRSATPERGETMIGEGFTWCTCHIWPAWGPHNECK